MIKGLFAFVTLFGHPVVMQRDEGTTCGVDYFSYPVSEDCISASVQHIKPADKMSAHDDSGV